MFQSLESYFQKHMRTLVRMQQTNPEYICGVLNTILSEQYIPITLDASRVTVKNGAIFIQGLSGGERHIITKKSSAICAELSHRSSGVIRDVRFQ